MVKYRFNFVDGQPETDKVNKHKDFKKLIYNYQKQTRPVTWNPLYKLRNRRIFLVILIILLLLWLLLSSDNDEEKNSIDKKNVNVEEIKEPVIHPDKK
ncbi:MAG: hypothetical protein ABIJ97_01665 [Bacteroidota bacterium]